MSITLKKSGGDIVIQASNGRPYWITGVEKLSQDVADVLMTTYNPETGFGHELDSLFNGTNRLSNIGIINATYIRNRVEEAISRLRSLQELRRDQIDAFETIDDVSDVQVYTIGSTGYAFTVEVTPLEGPNVAPQTFSINLSHQLLDSAAPNAPGGAITDGRA